MQGCALQLFVILEHRDDCHADLLVRDLGRREDALVLTLQVGANLRCAGTSTETREGLERLTRTAADFLADCLAVRLNEEGCTGTVTVNFTVGCAAADTEGLVARGSVC